MDIEQLLLKGARKDTGRQVLQPRKQAQVEIIAAVPTQHVYSQKNLTLCDLLSGGFALAELDAAFVQKAFNEKLE